MIIHLSPNGLTIMRSRNTEFLENILYILDFIQLITPTHLHVSSVFIKFLM